MIFHIPHSSTTIPKNIRNHFLLNDSQLKNEIKHMTDWFTADLFKKAVNTLGVSVEFPVSRLVVDPERFFLDKDEIMSKVGMGVIYEKTYTGNRLRKYEFCTDNFRNDLLDLYYFPHHDRLTELTEKSLLKNKKTIIVDCHSFPSTALPYELDQTPNRPDICIGTDRYHTPKIFEEVLYNAFSEMAYKVSINSPFSGSLVPLKYYKKNESVISVMIEINRRLYMDEEETAINEKFEKVQDNIYEALKNLSILIS